MVGYLWLLGAGVDLESVGRREHADREYQHLYADSGSRRDVSRLGVQPQITKKPGPGDQLDRPAPQRGSRPRGATVPTNSPSEFKGRQNHLSAESVQRLYALF